MRNAKFTCTRNVPAVTIHVNACTYCISQVFEITFILYGRYAMKVDKIKTIRDIKILFFSLCI